MIRFSTCSSRCAALLFVLAAAACVRHRVEMEPTHHTVEIKPIYLTVDVNIRVQKELDRFFEDVKPPEEEKKPEGEGT